MSQLGFDKSIMRYQAAIQTALGEMMNEAQKEFEQNFIQQKNSETGQVWSMIVRHVPPPILDVTGSLRAETLSKANITRTDRSIILTINPIDKRGRSYAQYHMDGTDVMDARPFVTQSQRLTQTQKRVLESRVGMIFEATATHS